MFDSQFCQSLWMVYLKPITLVGKVTWPECLPYMVYIDWMVFGCGAG